jgi:hypothetical protein
MNNILVSRNDPLYASYTHSLYQQWRFRMQVHARFSISVLGITVQSLQHFQIWSTTTMLSRRPTRQNTYLNECRNLDPHQKQSCSSEFWLFRLCCSWELPLVPPRLPRPLRCEVAQKLPFLHSEPIGRDLIQSSYVCICAFLNVHRPNYVGSTA